MSSPHLRDLDEYSGLAVPSRIRGRSLPACDAKERAGIEQFAMPLHVADGFTLGKVATACRAGGAWPTDPLTWAVMGIMVEACALI